MGTDSDILQVQGVNSKGFGIIPKLLMQDKRLTAQAKAIYAYFCSYAGAGKTAFPRTSKITDDLAIGKNAYYRHFKLLKDYGYIKVEQDKSKEGKFTRNIFTLIENVPCTQKSDTVKKHMVKNHTSPCTQNSDTVKKHISPCTHFGDTDNGDTQNSDTNNNSIKNNSSKNNSQSSQSRVATSQVDRRTDIAGYTKLIHDNIQYEDLKHTNHDDIAMIDEIVSIMLDALMSRSNTVRISGEDKPRELLKHNLVRITNEDIKYVLWQFKSVTEPITKKRQYLLSMLYHSKMELEAHYTNLVNHDMGVN